ncbi:SDR family NAD(P)-dependent oxidoreductase [Brevundimonas abyssalis]|uniref:SDR family NAD(P)-dependent oxidoreductase n=1 Tax=Brevundimonas abyssalis TaxID=1125965 RepID=UPI00190F71A6|nr:SDR family NAD(P)-dependent oxidoreductase [Brevundimonas abyssalis]
MTSGFDPLMLTGRRALVTGGARGIGAAVVVDLARRGASVTFVDISLDQIDPILEGRAQALQLDVSDPAAVAAELGRHEPFDILVNNAGRDQHSFFTDTTPNDWADLLAVNLLSVFACTQAVLPAMQRARGGRIINVASEAGRLGSKGGSIYAAAKGGVIAFTKSIARENARFGITANVIAPGPIRTPLLDKAVKAGGAPLLAAMEQATLLHRLGMPQEVAGLVGYLATDSAAYITGEVIGVSGGMGC